MEFLKNIDFPEGIAPVDTLLKAAPKDGQPVVLVQQGESETALEVPAGEELTLVDSQEEPIAGSTSYWGKSPG